MPVPGVNGTINLMGACDVDSALLGLLCARALAQAKALATKLNVSWRVNVRRFMARLL
jgi:hypothetical protein